MSDIAAVDAQTSESVAELDRELERYHLEGHWRLPPTALPTAVHPAAQPWLWPWSVIRRLLLAAGESHEIEGGASRRTVRLCTPGLPAKWTTPTIHTSVQLVKPGEIAEAHRHTMGAFRFVIEGRGGYTTVDGEKLPMNPGDLILTPPGSWHDHGHEGDEPMMWIDGHDFPFVNHLNCIRFEQFSQRQQDVTAAEDHTRQRSGALRPHGLRASPSGLAYLYPGREAVGLLRALGEESHDPRYGISLDYVNPLTGGSVLPTIDCRLHRLRHGERTREHRGSPNVICHVVEGSGTTIAGGTTLRWVAGDIFVLPSWTWYQHCAESGEEAILLSISDAPILAAFALLRYEDTP